MGRPSGAPTCHEGPRMNAPERLAELLSLTREPFPASRKTYLVGSRPASPRYSAIHSRLPFSRSATYSISGVTMPRRA